MVRLIIPNLSLLSNSGARSCGTCSGAPDQELAETLRYITLEDGSHPVSVLELRHCLQAEARAIMEHVPDRNKFGL